MYDVYAYYNDNNEIVGLEIIFIEEGDEDDWDEEEENIEEESEQHDSPKFSVNNGTIEEIKEEKKVEVIVGKNSSFLGEMARINSLSFFFFTKAFYYTTTIHSCQ